MQLYLEHLQGKGLAQATVARRFGTVRLFLRMAYDEEIIRQDPTRRIQMPKVDHTLQRRTWFTTVDMDYPTLTGLDRYLDGRTEGPLFLNEWGNRLTRLNVQTILVRVSRHAGVTYHVTPHGIRRTHAKTAAEQGEDLLGIAESLRHVDSRVTRQSYIGLDSGRGALTRQRVSSVYAQMSG